MASATCSVTNRWVSERYELALWSYLTSWSREHCRYYVTDYFG
jgi:hypothetical protein